VEVVEQPVVEAQAAPSEASKLAWRVDWLTPARARIILACLLGFGFLAHLKYLINNCPLDLSGDEAHYWDWSRQLDLSYYSKGPLVAYIIRASCAIFGDVMWAVRLPALVLGVGTSLLTYWLTRKLFGSERLALGAVLLTHIVPMFIAGSVMMTIDPPYYFCWAAATCAAVLAIRDGKRWAWPLIGVAIGLGFLAKYAAFLWLVGLGVLFLVDRPSRRWMKTPWPWMTVVIALLFTIPVLVWNTRHGWVTVRHVAKQTGTSSQAAFQLKNVGEFVGGQFGAMGPPMFILIVAACWWGWRSARRATAEHPWEQKFLLAMGLPFFLLVFATSFRAKVQVNWPAPAYFTLIILTACFLAIALHDRVRWKRWRGVFWAAVVLGLIAMPLAHNFDWLYPVFARFYRSKDPQKQFEARKVDPTARLRGWRELGAAIDAQLATLPPNAIVMCQDYMTTGETAFYVSGQPKTYYVGSYPSDPRERARFSQYDMWPDRRLDQPALLGRDAVYVGWMSGETARAFDHVEKLPDLEIRRRGVLVRMFELWRCTGFKGMKPQMAGGSY
jgi:undecaprenyl-diphosphatase